MSEYFTPEGAAKGVRQKRQTEVPVAYCTEVEGFAMEIMLVRELDPSDTIPNISVLDFAFSTDIKMMLILVGKMSASCSHACPFCTGSKPEWVTDSPRTTIGSLWQNYREFMKPVAEQGGGGNEKKAKQFNNVVRRPLVTGEDETQILGGVFFFPELHVLIGIVGKMMMELETSSVFESEKAGQQCREASGQSGIT